MNMQSTMDMPVTPDRRYANAKQVVLYIELEVLASLRRLYPGASNAVLLSTIIDRAMGPDFFERWRPVWPRKALPWHRGGELHRARRRATPAPRTAGPESRHGRSCLAVWYPAAAVEDALTTARSGADDGEDALPYRRTLHRTLWRMAILLASGMPDPVTIDGRWRPPESVDAHESEAADAA